MSEKILYSEVGDVIPVKERETEFYSDGLPAHEFDKYYPPLSVMDTALTVSKILQRGTKIAAVALDYENSYSTYDNLKQIYPYLVSCNKLERLPALLFKIIVKMIGE